MSLGPGKYDPLCTHVREQAKAKCALVIVIGGELGSGFSMQTEDVWVMARVPSILRDTAKQIEDSFAKS